MDSKLLEVLRCPVSNQSLALADAQALEAVNKSQPEEAKPWEACVVTKDGARAYEIKMQSPILLASRSLRLK